jgi:chromosome partitioning protein
MRIWSFCSQKGGSHKSSLVTQLAVCAEQDGEVCLIADLDPQRSSVSWSKARETDAPNVLPCLPEKLKDLLKQAVKEGITIAILDTAPHSDAATLTAMRHSDLICLPLQPSSFDTLALIDTIKLLDMADKREAAVAIISGVPIRGEARADDAERAIKKLGVKVSPVRYWTPCCIYRCDRSRSRRHRACVEG